MKTVPRELVRMMQVERLRGPAREAVADAVAIEEPLGIFLEYWSKEKQRTESLTVTMRTPGNDHELAIGHLYSEGVLQWRSDLKDIRHLGGNDSNELLVELAKGVDVDAWRLRRTSIMQASCGICGKQNVDVLGELGQVAADDFVIDAQVIFGLPEILRAYQTGFAQTGGLHAAALVGETGEIANVFEDIGRHNALDKLIGACFLAGTTPLARKVLFLSSRGSFELVQKAAAAGAPILATVGSPSTLAIEAAERAGVTLIGFVRDGRFNVYSGFKRIRS
ncbi:MAG TPA: formate dehydrogenase accessory sulfurtransferase FdhD [Bryobacteraceae bacterium]|nr:formate dehydrogenase accessory sulfurtransferase FdhD [Bryobacteraceae bacterium]